MNKFTSQKLFLLFVLQLFFVLTSCNKTDEKKSNKTQEELLKQNISKKDSVKFEKLNIKVFPGVSQYFIDTSKSNVEWSCDIHKGYVKFKEGRIGIKKNEIVSGNFVVDMNSIIDIDIDYELMKGTLEKILKSADFFNVKTFPTSVFRIDNVQKIENEKYSVSGYLKIFNIIKPVEFKSNIHINSDTLIAKSEKFFIDRTQWGLTVYTKDHIENEDGFIVPDEVYFKIYLVAYLQKR